MFKINCEKGCQTPGQQPYDNLEDFVKGKRQKKKLVPNVIKLRNDEPSRYYCLDGVFI